MDTNELRWEGRSTSAVSKTHNPITTDGYITVAPHQIVTTTFTTDTRISVTAESVETSKSEGPRSFQGNSLNSRHELPTELGTMRIIVTDSTGKKYPAGKFSVVGNEVNWIIPSGVADGNAIAKFYKGGKEVFAETLSISRVSPGHFTRNAMGTGAPVAFTLLNKASGEQSLDVMASSIDLGSSETDQVFLILCGTGYRNHADLSTVKATIGDQPTEVYYAGASKDHRGLDQINLLIPRSLIGSGEVFVNVSVGGIALNTVIVNIK